MLTNTPQADPAKLAAWPYATHPQFAPDEIKSFRKRDWVPLELAEAKLQWWQERDWQNAQALATLETRLAHMTEAAGKMATTLKRIADLDYDDLAGDPGKWACIIAKDAHQAYEASHD